MSLEQQIDALIAEHRLSSITLARIVRSSTGEAFWSINAQGDGKIGSNWNDGDMPEGSSAGITLAIGKLNEARAALAIVPELAEVA